MLTFRDKPCSLKEDRKKRTNYTPNKEKRSNIKKREEVNEIF